MNIQEHLTVFDRWLTSRLEEAHGRCKDLAFRDRADAAAGEPLWEYSLLEPGARSPRGEGWSVYRLQGIWPELAESEPDEPLHPAAPERRSLLDALSGAVLGRGAGR